MEMYLVESEIEELKGLRHQNINYSELNELKKYLEKNKKTLSLINNRNGNNVFDISFEKHKNTILGSEYYKEFREKNPYSSMSNWELGIFEMYMDKIDPEGHRIFNIARSINLEDNKAIIVQRLKEFKIENFDLDNFFLDKDFDFTPYQLKESDKKEYESIADCSNKILDLFESITKNLSDENKQVYRDNFFQIFDYTIKNIFKNDLKTKNNYFRNLLIFIDGKRTKN